MTCSPKPIHLLAGGGSWRMPRGADPLLERVFALAARRRPAIAYIGAASDDDRGFMRKIGAYFRKAGAGEVRLAPTVSAGTDLEETRRVLDVADLVFISGGDVETGMAALERSGVLPRLGDLYHAGKPFFGLSAGSIMLARCWVRWPDPADDHSAEVFDCMSFAPILCDTHAEADDWEELRALLRLTGDGAIGYGIPSGGALSVSADGTVTALHNPAPRLQCRNGLIVDRPALAPV